MNKDVIKLRKLTNKSLKVCDFTYRFCNCNFDRALKLLKDEKEDDRCI